MPDEDPGYLDIKPGDRVFIEYEDPLFTKVYGGPATVVHVSNAWTAKVKRDRDGKALTYCRWLLRPP